MRFFLSVVEWKERFLAAQYRFRHIPRTEQAVRGDAEGVGRLYRCFRCGNALFSPEAQFGTISRWPSFWAPISSGSVNTAVREITRFSAGNEVTCGRCGGHLGYVVEDGRPPAGIRYFINALALEFGEQGKESAAANRGTARMKAAVRSRRIPSSG
jgi:peptide methionine sulfoxide reductase MsrB